MSGVDQKFCDERAKNLSGRIANLESTVYGNSKKGIKFMSETVWDWYQKQNLTRAGWIDWAFRLIIMIMLAKLGLKP